MLLVPVKEGSLSGSPAEKETTTGLDAAMPRKPFLRKHQRAELRFP